METDMGKKEHKDEAKKEKPIYGSGAEPKPEPKDDGLVKCVCTVPCAWRGYHDEGDRVWIKRELIEKDAFIRAHFKRVDVDHGGSTSQDGDTRDEGETAADEGETAADEGETAADGQGELGLN